MAKAKREGKIAANAPVTVDALEGTGMSRTEAEKSAAAASAAQ